MKRFGKMAATGRNGSGNGRTMHLHRIKITCIISLCLCLFAASCGGESDKTTPDTTGPTSTKADLTSSSTPADETPTTTAPEIIETARPLSSYEVIRENVLELYPFEYIYPDAKGNMDTSAPMNTIRYFIQSTPATIRVRVTGYLPERHVHGVQNRIYTSCYEVEILEVYMSKEDYDLSQRYMLTYLGNPAVPFHRIPPLDIGSEYIVLNAPQIHPNMPDELGINSNLKIEEIDGVEYVYPFALLCDEIENNIPITDPEEARMHTDPAIIKYYADNGVELPIFNYKFELNDFIRQVKQIRGR